MSGPDPAFPTFCHISEYGEAGYRNLHRILSFSAPLNLWAPSSVLIRNSSSITPKAFIRYVEEGAIRIHGRVDWITDRKKRDEHPWPGAAWDNEIDDALQAIWRQGQNEPEAAQQVVIAQPEKGPDLARRYLEAHPKQVDRWYRIFTSAAARSKLPPGTRGAAERAHSKGPAAVVTAILRDAFNHGLAVREAKADVPLLLTSADRQFLKLLEGSWLGDSAPAAKPATKPMLASDLAGQLIEVLHHLDIHRGNEKLDHFLKKKGRRLLVAWLSDMCRRYRDADPRQVDNIVITELRSQLDRATFARPVREALLHPAATAGGLVGFILATADFVGEPTSAVAITGMAASVVQVSGGAAKQFGIVPSSYDGPQWPFFYAYRSSARAKQVQRLKYVLSEFRSR